MNLTSLRTLVLGAIVVALAVAACGGAGGESKSEPTIPPATQAPQPEPTQAAEPTVALEPTATSAETQPQATESPAEPTPSKVEPESGIPYNVPVMEGAADLEIQDTGTVTYLMKETMIEDVVEFYQTVMPEQGWELVTASEIGLMSTLVFQTAEARVSISLQANNIAKTVTVRMFIIKK